MKGGRTAAAGGEAAATGASTPSPKGEPFMVEMNCPHLEGNVCRRCFGEKVAVLQNKALVLDRSLGLLKQLHAAVGEQIRWIERQQKVSYRLADPDPMLDAAALAPEDAAPASGEAPIADASASTPDDPAASSSLPDPLAPSETSR